MNKLKLTLGVKSDPIEYRYSYPWLFRLLAEEGIEHVQLGSFFEVYQLPDAFFAELRGQAESSGIRISSLFTAHRELGGFFRSEPGFEAVARRNFERFIEVGALLGAKSVGSNPGAVMRDQMSSKVSGTACYVRHMKELMTFAKERGVDWLTIEPMSCLAEPPTLPDEMRAMAEELIAYQRANASTTARIGYCTDIAHGYADEQGRVVFDNLQLLDATLPYLYELHIKNTDTQFNSTFGFTESDRQRGIIDLPAIRSRLLAAGDEIPVQELICYLEVGGPKLGRDYTDGKLEASLRESLRYLRSVFDAPTTNGAPVERNGLPTAMSVSSMAAGTNGVAVNSTATRLQTSPVRIAPSVMCADQLRLLEAVRQLEAAGVDLLHLDIMDGHFAPNLSMSLPQIELLRSETKLPLDVHLMVNNNDLFVDLLAKLGVDAITVHAESCLHLDRTLATIRDRGMQAGVALNPHTPVETLRYVADRLDYVVVMTVNPGFAGQRLVPSAMRKIADVRQFLNEVDTATPAPRSIPISVDGNVSFENIPGMVAAGADILVAGTSSLFQALQPLAVNLATLNAAVEQGLSLRQSNRVQVAAR